MKLKMATVVAVACSACAMSAVADADACSDAAVDARIEKLRKADAEIPGFKPGSAVKVEQLTHEFKFGANMFVFGQLGSRAANEAYRAAFTNVLNAATIPFYWKEIEPERGRFRFAPSAPADTEAFWNSFDFAKDDPYGNIEFRRPAPDPLVAFCRDHGISMHGHVLVYMAYIPKWLDRRDLSKAEVASLIAARIRHIAERYGDAIDQWDVVNEATGQGESCTVEHPDDRAPWYVRWNKIQCPLPDDFTFQSFAEARKAFPKGVRLAINDAWPENQCYPALAKWLVDRGAPIDVIGLQRHIFKPQWALAVARGEMKILPGEGTAWGRAEQIDQLKRLDRAGKPIHISEITIPSPRGLDGLTDDEADAIQAKMLRDNYRLWFSWPSVYRITYWNLVDGTGAKNERMSSGLFNRDMTPKAAWKELERLVNREWRTRTEVVADAAGTIRFRGFKGRYRLSGRDSSGAPAAIEMTLSDNNRKTGD